jgi:CheY-like chemotaxis protein
MANQDTSDAGGPRILVVDDNAMSRKVIAYRLQKDGYDVAAAASGPEALALVENGLVDLIFLDLVMEGMAI